MLTRFFSIAILALVATAAAGADALAGQVWICSVASAVAADEDGTVGPPDLGGRERPSFFRLDADKKELTILWPDSRRGEITKIDAVREAEGQHVFTTVENGRIISIIVTAEGRMTLSIVSDGAVWSVFGHALPEGQTK
jgi:hypothetical protein